ncbi:RNA-guided endonuclease InsQ/TnpB family protein, partial [Thermogemmatispora sp.]|uniref:RNA-guided endonuclease InsQ/TnpB family protein n=1 Tax=Thermogemmatispora sp. TaxID=1968838 RepID=UPI0035E42CFE
VKELKATTPDARDIHSHVLQVVVADLDRAFTAFFRRVKAGEKPGYPRFKGKNRFSSFGFKEYGNGFKIDGRRLRLYGIGRVPVRWQRLLPCPPKTVRIVRKADGWYALFTCEGNPVPLSPTGKTVGIDVRITSLITTSDGEKVPNPKWYRAAQKKLRRQQRRMSRRQKGGRNWRKAAQLVARHHLHVSRQRQDVLDKIVHHVVHRYDFIAVEDLQIRNMVRTRYLAKSILDAGWGYFRTRLHVKAAEAGRVVIEGDPAYTSQTCSSCGQRFPEQIDLSVRMVSCPCGLVLDRDVNAAINILRLGRSRWASTSAAAGVAQEAAGL